MNDRPKLTRPREGRMLAGVCAGFAKYFGLDVTLIRIVYVLATIFTAFAGALLYFIMLIIIPEEPNRFLRND